MDWDLVTIFVFIFAIVVVMQRGKLARRAGLGPDPVDLAALERAQALAGRLGERIDHLERILDEDVPGWRGRGGL